MNWITELPTLDLSGKKYSQWGEEILIAFIFKNIGTSNRFLVDIGAGGANHSLSNTRALIEKGWQGLLFDMVGTGTTIREFITPDNIVDLLKEHNCPKEFDFLSVDLDSFDYDIIDNVLKEYKPVLICAEYNATLDPYDAVKLQYEEGYTWDGTNKYGFSFKAGVELFFKHGYTTILNHNDINLFAIRQELVEGNIELSAEKNPYHAFNPNAVFVPC